MRKVRSLLRSRHRIQTVHSPRTHPKIARESGRTAPYAGCSSNRYILFHLELFFSFRFTYTWGPSILHYPCRSALDLRRSSALPKHVSAFSTCYPSSARVCRLPEFSNVPVNIAAGFAGHRLAWPYLTHFCVSTTFLPIQPDFTFHA